MYSRFREFYIFVENISFMKKVDHSIVMELYDQLMENAVHQKLVKYLSKEYYYETIHEKLKELYGETYQPEVVKKIINAELKKKTGTITLIIISEFKKLSNDCSHDEAIRQISLKVKCPIGYVERVIETI